MRDLNEVFERHRGPYIFCVGRPHPKKAGFVTCEWLKGGVDDPIDEARALLYDPRDTIGDVGVYSEHEQQFVTTITKRYFEARANGV
jgi:hypothetical protein